MSLQERVPLPDHLVHGEELKEIWGSLMSFSNAFLDEAGVVVEEVHDEKIGDFTVIHLVA